jgi:hypothetical protein
MANFLLDQSLASSPDPGGYPMDVFHKWDALQRIAQTEFLQGNPVQEHAWSQKWFEKDFISDPLGASGKRFPTIDPARIRTTGPEIDFATGSPFSIDIVDEADNPWGTRFGGYSTPGNPNFQPIYPAPYIQYATTLNPQLKLELSKDFLHSTAHPYHKGMVEAEMMPLASYQDPAYHYRAYNLAGRSSDAAHQRWKTLMSNPSFAQSDMGPESADNMVANAEAFAENKKRLAIEADMGHKRQFQIAKLRQADPEFNATAQRLEQAARDLQQSSRSGKLNLATANKLVSEFEAAYLNAQKAMAQKGLSVLQAGAPRMGYLMEGAGTASMIPDIARLVAGGDIAIGANGLPFIASKAEMGAPSGVPREGTPGEALWTQESDEENKARLAELDRSDKAMKSEKALRKQAYDYMVKNNPNRKVIEKQEQIKSSLQDWADAYFK